MREALREAHENFWPPPRAEPNCCRPAAWGAHRNGRKKNHEERDAHHADERHTRSCWDQRVLSSVLRAPSCCGLKEGTVVTVTTTLENSESSLLLLLRDLGLLHHQPQRPLACRAFLGCLQSIGTLGAMSLDGLTNATALSASLSSTCVFPPHAAARRAAVCEPLFLATPLSCSAA